MSENFDNKGSDFHSLLSSPEYDPKKAGKKEKDAKKVSTDFQVLKEELGDRKRPFQRRTLTDLLIDGTTPFLIFVMVLSIMWFLLDIRFVYTESENTPLRIFVFSLVVGIVALNRVVARNSADGSILYILGLGGVTFVFSFVITGTTGSVARNFLDQRYVSAAFNMTIISLIWWITNRLTHECCVDENQTAGDVGILTGTVRSFQQAVKVRNTPRKKAPPSKRPKDHILETTELEAVDPLDWIDPETKTMEAVETAPPSKRLAKRHPGISIFYFTVPVMVIFALGLPVLMQGGPRFVNAGHAYVGLFTTSALALLMLTSLGGLRQYFRSRKVHFPAQIGAFWLTLGTIMLVSVLLFAISMPMPSLPRMASIDEHETDFWTRDSTFELQSPASSLTESVQQSQILYRLRIIVFVFFAFFGVFSLIRALGFLAVFIGHNRDVFPGWVSDIFNSLDALLQKYVRLPTLPKFKRRIRIHPAASLSAKFQNPMKGEGAVERDRVEQYVAQGYDALCALAHDMGVPRKPDQTPYEFLEAFPKELNNLQEVAHELTELYVQTAYSKLPPDDRVLDRLRKFWTTYEKVRIRYIR